MINILFLVENIDVRMKRNSAVNNKNSINLTKINSKYFLYHLLK